MNILRHSFLVFKRELIALLTLPLFYVLAGIFFLLTSAIYLVTLYEFAFGVFNDPDLTVNVTVSVVRPTFHSLHFFLLVQIPLLTMRVFAEDRSIRMLDLLQTTPAKDMALVIGKFAGTYAGLVLYLTATFLFPLMTSFVSDIEWPVAIGSMIALLLSAAAYTAIGVFFSAITESQVVAAVLSYVTIFTFIFASFFSDGFGILPLQQAVQHFAVLEHVGTLLSGEVAPMNIMYFIVVTAIFLFLSVRILEARRWASA